MLRGQRQRSGASRATCRRLSAPYRAWVSLCYVVFNFIFQAEDGIRDGHVTGVQTCALPRSFLLPVFSNAFLRGSHTITLNTCGLSRSYSQAALVPSSNVTHKVPFNPWRNSRMVAAFVSIKDSITSFPLASLTAMDMLA